MRNNIKDDLYIIDTNRKKQRKRRFVNIWEGFLELIGDFVEMIFDHFWGIVTVLFLIFITVSLARCDWEEVDRKLEEERNNDILNVYHDCGYKGLLSEEQYQIIKVCLKANQIVTTTGNDRYIARCIEYVHKDWKYHGEKVDVQE